MMGWEDFKVGDSIELGRHTFTEEEMLDFGRRGIGMRLMVDNYLGRCRSLGSPGVENIRWLKPVRAGDTLTYRRIVLESRASATRKDMGLVKHRWEAVNQDGSLVFTMEGWGMFGRKN